MQMCIKIRQKGIAMKKYLNAAIRNLTSLSTECLRFGDSALMAEVQAVLIRLLEIQEKVNQLPKKEEK